jgi:hypothetical protein
MIAKDNGILAGTTIITPSIMQDVGAYVWKQPGCRKRLVCFSPQLQAHIWPYTFSLFMPAARSMSQWASRNGAKIHPALRLVSRGDKGVGVVTLRPLAAGTPVMSVPLKLALASSNEDRQTIFLGMSNPREQLAHMFVRGLVDPTCQWKTYFEFLHDTHNMEGDEESILHSSPGLIEDVDAVMDGNALVMSGVPNAPFLDKKLLTQAKHRVQWVRWQQARRDLEQAVPHYAAQAAAWGISMVLSRCVPCPEEMCDSTTQEYMVVPLVDLLNHNGRSPTATCVFTFPPSAGSLRQRHSQQRVAMNGMVNYNKAESHVHVVVERDIPRGTEITLRYTEVMDPEHWLLNWGFVPKELQKRLSQRKKL